ncbi:MAG: hypothetical protein ABIH83_01915 [Candidatus Micrarchaeota archaeon]
MHIIRKWEYTYPGGDLEIIEVIQTHDKKYSQGIKFSFLYLRYEPPSGAYVPMLAIDNSHGQTHLHYLGRKPIPVNYDWKQALSEFDRLVEEYRKREGLL